MITESFLYVFVVTPILLVSLCVFLVSLVAYFPIKFSAASNFSSSSPGSGRA